MIRANRAVTISAAEPKASPRARDCQGVSEVLARVGDKWSVLIVMTLGGGSRRFNELKRSIGGISQRMLTLTLRGLERDGLVTRTMYPTIPPRVDYALTDLGHSLWKPVEVLGKWAHANQATIQKARRAFDERESRKGKPRVSFSRPSAPMKDPSLRSG